jgi:isopenicillin N synthase-like dioxygenase
MMRSPHFRGYNLAGQELTRGRRDWREQVDIGPERDAVPQGTGVPPWTRLQGPNQWPPTLPSLRPALAAYTDATTALAIRLLRAFAEALGQRADAFAPIHTPSPHWLLKIIRYPGRDATEDDQGVGAHKDGGFLTLLLQDDTRGLQVEAEDGRWIDAEPLPGSFVVNIGELLELASDGYLRATVHRAVTPLAGADRLSIGYFFGANLDATVPQLALPPALAAERRGVTRDPDDPLLRDTGLNALKGRLRSHPDVAARHHADLVAGVTS